MTTKHDHYIDQAPHPQHAVDLFEWLTRFPDSVGVQAGQMSFYDDPRIHWALETFGGIRGQSVLELGPYEAGHTLMLHAAGAKEIVAIEANTNSYLKCLVVKELLDLNRAKFLLEDFLPWLEVERRKWDAIFASGVLYHMVDPLRFLELLSLRTDRLFIWTHYADQNEMPENDPRYLPATSVENHNWRGRNLKLYRRSYHDAPKQAGFCGGVHANPAWLHKDDIQEILKDLGFSNVEIGMQQPDHPAGPAYCITAIRHQSKFSRLRSFFAKKFAARECAKSQS